MIQDLVMEFLRQQQNHDKDHKQFFIVKKKKKERKLPVCVIYLFLLLLRIIKHYVTVICIRFHLLYRRLAKRANCTIYTHSTEVPILPATSLQNLHSYKYLRTHL